jgi:hypothetical protein
VWTLQWHQTCTSHQVCPTLPWTCTSAQGHTARGQTIASGAETTMQRCVVGPDWNFWQAPKITHNPYLLGQVAESTWCWCQFSICPSTQTSSWYLMNVQRECGGRYVSGN